ncbi:MAG: S46 family peptidase, partial [Gemmatimonadota bacterium]
MKSTGVRGTVAGVLVTLALTGCSSGSGGPAEPAGPPRRPPAERPMQQPPERPPVRTDTASVETAAASFGMRTDLDAIDVDTVRAGRFDQGKMWTFEFPPVEYFQDEYGLELDSAWFRKARLSALRIPSCSASFVSPNGLVMTNHHCARSSVTDVAQEGEELLDQGFYARSLDEERPVEDFHADQLVEIVDISAEVEERTAGLAGGNLLEARENALEDIQERMQDERGGEDAGWVVETISLYNGARFSAYVFRRYDNVKLVMAPELQIGFFGGDPDNFTYPRYNLDFSFFRIYDDEGEPLRTENWFQWSDRGAEAGDPIFIIG